jgi:PAS domain S-box-containing protein
MRETSLSQIQPTRFLGAEYDVFGFGGPSSGVSSAPTGATMRRPSMDQNRPNIQATLSAALKHAMNPSPIDYRATFKTEGTCRLLTKDNIIVDATERFCHDVGYTYSELVGMHMNDLTPTVKQPMCRLISQRSTHGCEGISILNSYKTKRGGVVFRYGILEVSHTCVAVRVQVSIHPVRSPLTLFSSHVFLLSCFQALWEHSRCTGTGGAKGESIPPSSGSSHTHNAPNFGSSYMELLTPSSTDSTRSATDSDGFGQPIAMHGGAQQQQQQQQPPQQSPCCSDEKFTFPQVPPCPLCGVAPKYHSFVGFPTSHTDIENYLMLSLRTALRSFDPDISMVGLELDEFYTRGKIAYETTSINTNGSGFVTSKMTRLLPMRFVQAVQIYDQLARTAAATKTSPPRIEL